MISTTQDRVQTKTTSRWGEFFANYGISLSEDSKFIIPHDHPQFDEIMYQIDGQLDYDVGDDAMIIDMNVREHFPFKQKRLSSNTFLRKFDENVNSEELIWHMDREDRHITVKSGKNWKLQLDNEVPKQLVEGKTYFIPKLTYHRVIKGDEKLILFIKENKSQGENDKMSLKKEEILWLLENSVAEKPNCGCGKDPCETYGTLDATVDGDALNVDMSAMTISGKPDHEIEMAHKQLHRAASQAQSLADRMHDMGETNLPAWVQSKITMASDYISKVHGYLDDLLSGGAEESQEIIVMKEEMEGEVAKASHSIEIDLNISKSDMKKLHNGEKVVLKDETGSNSFTVTVTAS